MEIDDNELFVAKILEGMTGGLLKGMELRQRQTMQSQQLQMEDRKLKLMEAKTMESDRMQELSILVKQGQISSQEARLEAQRSQMKMNEIETELKRAEGSRKQKETDVDIGAKEASTTIKLEDAIQQASDEVADFEAKIKLLEGKNDNNSNARRGKIFNQLEAAKEKRQNLLKQRKPGDAAQVKAAPKAPIENLVVELQTGVKSKDKEKIKKAYRELEAREDEITDPKVKKQILDLIDSIGK